MSGALEFTLKIGCSNNCGCCPQDKLIKAYSGPNKMTTEVFRKIISHVPTDVLTCFSGFCEIFLNENADTMLCEANDKGHQVSLYTTLVGATEQQLQNIKHIPFVVCTIHAPDSVYFLYDRDKWVEKYRYFLTLNIPHHLVTLGPSSIPFRHTRHTPHTRAGNVQDVLTRTFGRIGCRVGEGQKLNNNIVLPNGDVYICCMSYGLKHKLGNLLIDDWEYIHSKYYYRNIVNLMNMENSDLLCRTCHEGIKL